MSGGRRPTEGHPSQQAIDLFRILDGMIEDAQDPTIPRTNPGRLPLGELRVLRANLFNAHRRATEADPTRYKEFRNVVQDIQDRVAEPALMFVGKDDAAERAPEVRQYPSRHRQRDERKRRDAA